MLAMLALTAATTPANLTMAMSASTGATMSVTLSFVLTLLVAATTACFCLIFGCRFSVLARWSIWLHLMISFFDNTCQGFNAFRKSRML